MKPGVCRSCNADIIWTKTKDGAAFPIDPVPVVGGNIYIRERDQIAMVVPKDMLGGRELYYVTHFATCPHAAQHRKGRE